MFSICSGRPEAVSVALGATLAFFAPEAAVAVDAGRLGAMVTLGGIETRGARQVAGRWRRGRSADAMSRIVSCGKGAERRGRRRAVTMYATSGDRAFRTLISITLSRGAHLATRLAPYQLSGYILLSMLVSVVLPVKNRGWTQKLKRRTADDSGSAKPSSTSTLGEPDPTSKRRAGTAPAPRNSRAAGSPCRRWELDR